MDQPTGAGIVRHCGDPAGRLGVDRQTRRSIDQLELLPGDRLFIKADRSLATDNALAKFLAPIERIFGAISLGAVAQQSASGRLNGGVGSGS